MIRIQKPAQSPEVLQTKGASETRRMKAAYSRNPARYHSGEKTFTFDSKIYAHSDVKTALIKAQFGKCCFCESQVTHISYGDVEHFRPKAASCQSDGQPLECPGYFWLAYDWANLFFSCQLCNQRHKKNFFPLADPQHRAWSHKDDLSAESPLFINPAEEDPEAFITFHKEVVRAVDGNRRGAVTIESLGLDRSNLEDRRLKFFQVALYFADLIKYAAERPEDSEAQDIAARAKEWLEEAVLNSSEYAGMVRAAVRANFTY